MNTSPLTASGDYEVRDRWPHWYALLNPLQDDGFGEIVCAKEEVNSFVYSFIYEGTDCGTSYYATGHA